MGIGGAGPDHPQAREEPGRRAETAGHASRPTEAGGEATLTPPRATLTPPWAPCVSGGMSACATRTSARLGGELRDRPTFPFSGSPLPGGRKRGGCDRNRAPAENPPEREARCLAIAETGYEIAFDVSNDALQRQELSLDSLRTRAATVLSGASIATAFLGAQALKLPLAKERQAPWLCGWEWLAAGSFIALAFTVIVIMWPRKNWVFTVGARHLIGGYVEVPAGTKRCPKSIGNWRCIWKPTSTRTRRRSSGCSIGSA